MRMRCGAYFRSTSTWLGDDGFVQYAVDDFDVRLVVLDTTVPGEPGGELCARRLQWLDRTLGESDRPTIIAQHHPPFATGLTMMDRMSLANPEAEAAVIARHRHVQCIISGHFHRTSRRASPARSPRCVRAQRTN